MNFLRFLALALLAVPSFAQSILPSSGLAGLKRQSLELSSDVRVVMLSVAPGDEDLDLALRLKAVRGARIMFAYLTNGEASLGAWPGAFPHHIAADLRERAFTVVSALEGDHRFLNLPEVDAASSLGGVRLEWNADTVRARLLRDVLAFDPDAILVCGAESARVGEYVRTAIVQDLDKAIESRERLGNAIRPTIAFARATENPANLLKGRTVWGASLAVLRDTLSATYDHVASTRKRGASAYEILSGSGKVQRVEQDGSRAVRARVPVALRSLDSLMQRFSSTVLSLGALPSGVKADHFLRDALLVRQQIERSASLLVGMSPNAKRYLFDWLKPIEAMRTLMLRANVQWSLTEHIVTGSQLTYLSIDSVAALDPGGSTEIYFPMVKQGWIINESLDDRLPYQPGMRVRILSPKTVPFDLPRALDGLARPVFRSPWYFLVIHHATNVERSFSISIDADITTSPRFTTEVLTPLVRAEGRQDVPVRLTNHSRDGVRDVVLMRDSIVVAEPVPFRLSSKESSVTLDVSSVWIPGLVPGTYLADIRIGQDAVARVAGRKFPSAVDSSKTVGVIAPFASSPAISALRRLGVTPKVLKLPGIDERMLDSLDVVIVEEYAARTFDRTADDWKAIGAFAERGGHVVLLAQDASSLAGSGLWKGLRATRDATFDMSAKIIAADTVRLFSWPNDLKGETWENWVYRRATNRISVPEGMEVAAKLTRGDAPVIVRRSFGKGVIHYVDLNLDHQLMNVDPACHQLLANLISY